jgi:hypothetical protein
MGTRNRAWLTGLIIELALLLIIALFLWFLWIPASAGENGIVPPETLPQPAS